MVTLQSTSQLPRFFHPRAVASLLDPWPEGLFVSDYDVRGKITAFRHGF